MIGENWQVTGEVWHLSSLHAYIVVRLTDIGWAWSAYRRLSAWPWPELAADGVASTRVEGQLLARPWLRRIHAEAYVSALTTPGSEIAPSASARRWALHDRVRGVTIEAETLPELVALAGMFHVKHKKKVKK